MTPKKDAYAACDSCGQRCPQDMLIAAGNCPSCAKQQGKDQPHA